MSVKKQKRKRVRCKEGKIEKKERRKNKANYMETSIDVRAVTLVKQLLKPCHKALIILLFAFSSFFPSFRHSCVKITSSPHTIVLPDK